MKRGDMQLTAIDIDVLVMSLAEAKISSAASEEIYETPAHKAAADRLTKRLVVLYRQVTDEVPA